MTVAEVRWSSQIKNPPPEGMDFSYEIKKRVAGLYTYRVAGGRQGVTAEEG